MKNGSTGTRPSIEHRRFVIQICPKRAKALTIESLDDRSEAILKARALSNDARVHDTKTGRTFLIRLERWVSQSTLSVIVGEYSDAKPDKGAEADMLAPLLCEEFAEEFSEAGL